MFRKTLILLIALLWLAASPALAAMDIYESHWPYFQAVVQGSGYVCDTTEGGYALGKRHRGSEFKVFCNANTLVYRVTIHSSGIVLVEPW